MVKEYIFYYILGFHWWINSILLMENCHFIEHRHLPVFSTTWEFNVVVVVCWEFLIWKLLFVLELCNIFLVGNTGLSVLGKFTLMFLTFLLLLGKSHILFLSKMVWLLSSLNNVKYYVTMYYIQSRYCSVKETTQKLRLWLRIFLSAYQFPTFA